MSRLWAVLFLTVWGSPGCLGDRDWSPKDNQDQPDIAVPRNQVELLPYRVRLARVATIAGVPEADPLLDRLRGNAQALGDHNFATGVSPDLRWTSSRMGIWVKSLVPVCDSQQIRERFPGLPEDPSALIEAAYGRAANADDIAALQLGPGPMLEDSARRLLCLAVLSSAEFVSR